MKTTEQKIVKLIKKKKLLLKGEKVVLALSGGPDSVFALLFLHKFRGLFGIEIFAYHLNHMLRGKESDGDELFCINLCEKKQIEIFTEKKDVQTYAGENKLSLEEAARLVRYSGIEKYAESIYADKIITAHNKSDNTETVLLNLFKGTGVSGLSGIPLRRGKIIRPFLSVTSEDIRNYLLKDGIEARTDHTNFENDYQRNFIRNEILPLVRKNINPAVDDALFRNSFLLRDANKMIDNRVEELWEKRVHEKDNSIEIKLDEFINEENNLLGFILRHCFEEKLKISYSYNVFEKFTDLIESKKGTVSEFTDGYKAVRERNSIVIFKEADSEISSLSLSLGETIEIEDLKIGLEEVDSYDKKAGKDNSIEFFSLDDTDEDFIVRRWEEGDYFYPLGQKGKKNVSEFLVDAKKRAIEKKKQLVVENRNNIVWVIGLRLDNRFRIKDETKRIGKIWMK